MTSSCSIWNYIPPNDATGVSRCVVHFQGVPVNIGTGGTVLEINGGVGIDFNPETRGFVRASYSRDIDDDAFRSYGIEIGLTREW